MARNGTDGKASAHVQAKRERRRDEILRAALQAFRERGYHATTLDHIAARLGVRKTALYHYFADKDAILHACHVESLDQLEHILAEARRLPTPAGQLRQLIVEHVRVMAGTLDGTPLAVEVTALGAKHQAEIIYGRDRYEREIRRIIEQGIRAGAFRKVDAKIATFAVLGAINWVSRWYRPEGALDAATIGAQFADHLVGGLLARAKPRAAHRPRAGARARVARVIRLARKPRA
jgi:AcrR family transcriptional regulator